MKSYELIDLGCSEGGAVRYIRGAFKVGVNPGMALGVDLNAAAADAARAQGYAFLCADALKLERMGNWSARIVSMFHFLEHLWSWDECADALRWGAGVASDFVYAAGPAWDCEPQLRLHDLRLRWADYGDHRVPTTSCGIAKVCAQLGLAHRVYVSRFFGEATPGEGDVLAAGPRAARAVFAPPLYLDFTAIIWRPGTSSEMRRQLVSAFDRSRGRPDQHLLAYGSGEP